MSKQEPLGESLESLMASLAAKDGLVRKQARESLVALGKPAVASLSLALQSSKAKRVRWEAAKALGAIPDDIEAIPSLVMALEDRDTDVSWLAAEALEKLAQAAWPELLNALIERGADSLALRRGAHHVLRNQREAGLDDDLAALGKALESNTSTDTPVAAAKLLRSMRGQPERGE